MSRTAKQLLAAAVIAAIPSARLLANTVDGTVANGEYNTTLSLQNNPTGFGNNFSELDGRYSNYTPGGSWELAVTGNQENNPRVPFPRNARGHRKARSPRRDRALAADSL